METPIRAPASSSIMLPWTTCHASCVMQLGRRRPWPMPRHCAAQHSPLPFQSQLLPSHPTPPHNHSNTKAIDGCNGRQRAREPCWMKTRPRPLHGQTGPAPPHAHQAYHHSSPVLLLLLLLGPACRLPRDPQNQARKGPTDDCGAIPKTLLLPSNTVATTSAINYVPCPLRTTPERPRRRLAIHGNAGLAATSVQYGIDRLIWHGTAKRRTKMPRNGFQACRSTALRHGSGAPLLSSAVHLRSAQAKAPEKAHTPYNLPGSVTGGRTGSSIDRQATNAGTPTASQRE